MDNREEEKESSLKKKTAKGLFFGGLSNAIQQIIGFLFGLYVARNLLSPSDYGTISLLTIFALIATAFQESGFVMGLVNKREVSHKDYNAVFWCSLSISTLLYIALFFLAPFIADFYEKEELTALSRFLFISFWLGSFSIAHNAYLYRHLMVAERSIVMLSALIVSNIAGLIFAYYGFAYWSLAIQTVVYTFVSSSMFFYFSKFRPTLHIDFSPIKDIYKFSSKILITNIFIHINNNIYASVLGKFFSKQQIGFISQASKWNNMGQSLITNMINNVIQPVLNQIHDDENRQVRVFRKLLNFTSFVAFIMLFGLAAVADDFIRITLTDKWIESARYVRILCIGGAFATINNVFSNLILTKGQSSIYMFNIVGFGILQFLILILCKDFGLELSIMLISTLNLLWIFIWYVIVKRFIAFGLMQLISDVFTYVFLAGIACAAAAFLSQSISLLFVRFSTCILASGVFYLLLNKIFKPDILTEIINFAKGSLIKKK